MTHLSITPRRVAPYIISGATGVHILARMRYLSQQPAADMPLHFFLLKNSDVVLTIGGASVIIWQLARRKPGQKAMTSSPNDSRENTVATSLIGNVVHELRQIFTSLLIGLGLINNKAKAGNAAAIPSLVKRLNQVVRRGIDDVNLLEQSQSAGGKAREHGA
jgi:hypothetical protein